jgi:hypothetical protein
MEKIKSPYFKFEKKFLKDKELLSIVDCGENHNIKIDELMKKNVETVFKNSILTYNNEFITDYICKTTNNFYIYLSTTVMENRYMLKIYYKPTDKNFVDIFLKSLKK